MGNPKNGVSIEDASTIIGNLLQQIEQMRGMFDDSDGTIAAAVSEAEQFQNDCAKAGAMPQTTAADTFVERVAALKKWGEPDEDGEPFEPSDGVDDSHSCLMDLIDEARGIAAGQR